jgi:hypothetical protein
MLAVTNNVFSSVSEQTPNLFFSRPAFSGDALSASFAYDVNIPTLTIVY